MKKTLCIVWGLLLHTIVNGQQISSDQLLNLLSLSLPKLESQLSSKRFFPASEKSEGDTTFKTYEYRPSSKRGKNIESDSISSKIVRASLKESSTLCYQTTAEREFLSAIETLKKRGFYCEYEKDSTIKTSSYLYQHEDFTAEAASYYHDNLKWFCITFFKKNLSINKEFVFAEDLLEFTSHEYLVYYFGEKNIQKDIFYFAGNEVVNCSVFLIDTERQAVFIWKDGLNRRKIDNILLGGQHRLKSQQTNNKFIAENIWKLKSGVHAGMSLFELRNLNNKDISFYGGDAANPGLIVPESSNRVNFKNADVILGCMNCSDPGFGKTKMLTAEKAIYDGRILFVLTIALYPITSGIFD
jgi:hypothetical protein